MDLQLLTEEVQEFLIKNSDSDARKIALSKSPFKGISSSKLAEQIESRQKARKKLPEWYNTQNIYFPPSISVEQASSQDTGVYKSALIEKDSSLIDLTGGFGVDSFYFAKQAKSVIHCEINSELSALAEHNARQLGAGNIRFIHEDGIQFLLEQPVDRFDTVYLDPSRRVKTKKVFKLEDCEPDILRWQGDIYERSQHVLIKTSPLLDISLSLSQLKHIKEVHIVCIKNECKELIFNGERGFSGMPAIHAVELDSRQRSVFSFFEHEERATPLLIGDPLTYLYDPNASLLKAGCFKLVATRFGLTKLHMHTHLYSSDQKLDDFPGRTFRIQKITDYKEFKKRKTHPAANVIAKNFPLQVDVLRKKHKISAGGNSFLFFCKTGDERLQVIYADRVS